MSDNDLRSAAAIAFQKGFGALIRIEPEDSTPFVIDGRGAKSFTADEADAASADCVWRAQSETLSRIFSGGRALESAYLSGRLRISGDMSVMARLLLESHQ